MALIAKVAGYVILGLGLLLHAADLCGYLLESERLELYARIERAEDIPRGAPGFKKFLAAFPPPTGTPPEQVTHIRSSNLIGSGGVSAGVGIRYLLGEQRTPRVAGLIEASEWSRQTKHGWLSWWLIFAGLAIALCGEALGRRDRGAG